MNIFENEAESFEQQMKAIAVFTEDLEKRHAKMDELMCETLERFGCHEGVKIFRESKKYYA